VLPLALHLRVGTHEPHRILTGALCALVGGLALRVGILKTAPALLDRWPELTDGAPPGPLWQSFAGIGLLAMTVVLAVAIPWVLRRQWLLTGRQTALAGLASVFVCFGVSLYVLRPETGYPFLDDVLAVAGFSPELDRPRGGGPGASELNRPTETTRRSKINGTLPQ